MVFEHEIPEGSKLYFAATAKKRSSKPKLVRFGDAKFEEIITPLFSYHQHMSVCDQRELIRVNDSENHPISLRADSTIDVVRILNKRLGEIRSTKNGSIFSRCTVILPMSSIKLGLRYIDEPNFSCTCSSDTDFKRVGDASRYCKYPTSISHDSLRDVGFEFG
jgi:histidyl-tRNA synthetase